MNLGALNLVLTTMRILEDCGLQVIVYNSVPNFSSGAHFSTAIDA